MGMPRNYPAPTNLKVLPKNLTGAQVRDIMHKWTDDLGAECSTCHTPDPVKKMPNGHPALNYADDSKHQKQIARIMYTMTENLKSGDIQKAADLDKDMNPKPAELTCGTCHRGKLDPEAYIPARREGGPARMSQQHME